MSDQPIWKPEHFHQRTYTYEDDKLDSAKRISVEVKVNGRTTMELQAREPGILAIISRPDEEGIDVAIVEAGGVRYTDYRTPSGDHVEELQRWAIDALHLKE